MHRSVILQKNEEIMDTHLKAATELSTFGCVIFDVNFKEGHHIASGMYRRNFCSAFCCCCWLLMWSTTFTIDVDVDVDILLYVPNTHS